MTNFRTRREALLVLMGGLAAAVGGLRSTAVRAQAGSLRDMLPARIKASGTIKLGSPRAFPPVVFLKDEKLTGVAVDLSRAAEPLLGVKFDWQEMQWPGIIPGLRGGTIDVSWSVMSYVPERAAFLNIIPYVQDLVGLLAQPGAAAFADSSTSLCGRKLGTIQATNYSNYATDAGKRCVAGGGKALELLTYSNDATLLTSLQAGNIEGAISSYTSLSHINQSHGGKFKLYNMADFQAPPLSIATAKQEEGLAKALAAALKILHENGEYGSILKRYDMEAAKIDPKLIAINP